MVTHTLLSGALFPGLWAAAVTGLLSLARPFRAGAAGALGLAAGYLSVHRGIVGWQGLLPTDVTHRLTSLAALAGLLGLLSMGPRFGAAGRWAPALAAPVAAWALLTPHWNRLTAATWIGAWAGLTVALLALTAAWAKAAEDQQPLRSGVTLMGAALTLGAACAASGSLVLGQLTLGIAAAAGATSLTAWILRRPMGLEPMAQTTALLLGAVATLAGVYSTTSHGALALWALIPLGVLGTRTVTTGRLRPGPATGAQALVTVAIGAAAAVWAATAHAPQVPPGTPGEYDYGYGDG